MWTIIWLAACVTDRQVLDAYDPDGDGWYAPESAEVGQEGPFDCDSEDPDVNPGEDERCNAVDDDCDAVVDEDDAIDAATWYADGDRDGWGLASDTRAACEAPALYTDRSGDCDDADDGVHPEEEDVCNDVDDDCDGSTDEDEPTWFADADDDGFGDAAQSVASCTQPVGYVEDGTDCDDAAPFANPGASEVCDGEDNDCDGLVDLDDPDNSGLATWYLDDDEDGFGDPAVSQEACSAPTGFARTGDDCDDTLAAVNPGATESCESGLDEDCDGLDQTCGISGIRALTDASAHFTSTSGAQVAGVGDFDGDGNDDFVVAGSQVSLFLGSETLILGDLPLDAGVAEISPWGALVSPLSDLDADGYGDFATGAMVIYGQAGPSGVIDASTAGTTWTDAAGAITGGDLDADTVQDLLMPIDGGWKVVKGNGRRWSTEEAAVPQVGSSVTYGSLDVCDSVGSVGDVDGDGTDDILTGWVISTNCSDAEVVAGVGILHGGVTLGSAQLESDADTLLMSDSAITAWPPSVAYLPDFDGDGYGDIAATLLTSSAINIFYGTSAGVASGNLAVGEASIATIGTVAAPDTDGDGSTELFIAFDGLAIGFSGGTARGTYARTDADISFAGSTPSFVASGGDINADGADELLVGSLDDGAWLLYGGL